MNIQTVRTACIPASVRIYAVGDVHGMHDLLAEIQSRIDADMARSPIAYALEIYLGDMIDRGPDSAAVLNTIIARSQRRNVIALAGNHELMMIRALGDLQILEQWLVLGGDTTLQSFGLPRHSIAADKATQMAFRKALQPHILDFLMMMRANISIGDYLFVHAGLRPGVPLSLQSIDDMTSIRGEFLEFEESFGAIVVHGHTPCDFIDVKPNRINLDTGAFKSGILSCLVLEQDTLRLL